ncbi:MAG: TIGR02678 family protein [Frisingicoccus sp.]|uniref:TIGR02678 family protein n=1 Tax=Frisingicoccus sp. TaxID=1918627 RepID=UPI002A80392D|nr:TIGR02678 family protein [Frisingicoccus sp.]MDY4835294.1 TIGR02678 family protein [Frisingicoccus sp.]
MKELEILLDRRWILKSEDKELYYKVRDSIGEIRRFATEKMGCQIIENSLLVKMEKIPAIPQAFMGIEEFTSREEYVFLCMLLMFLEDKDGEEQFILSQLTEYIEANMPGTPVDWTIYTNRRRMVKVLRYAASQGLIKVTDGSDDVFMDEKSGEVLYENTGASRYFMRNFSRDIMDYTSPEDFRESDWFDVDEDRGIARRHRVYKRLLFSVGMYKNAGSEEDFEYLKYYGRRLAEDLEQNFDCQVHIHKGSAFFMMGDDCRMGAPFPGNNALSDIILLCCGKIREKVTGGLWKTGSDDRIIVEKIEFENMLKEVKAEKGSGFTKNYREMPEGEFVRELTDNLERWTFIGRDETKHQVVIYPSAGKMAGRYPEDYTGGNKNEQ